MSRGHVHFGQAEHLVVEANRCAGFVFLDDSIKGLLLSLLAEELDDLSFNFLEGLRLRVAFPTFGCEELEVFIVKGAGGRLIRLLFVFHRFLEEFRIDDLLGHLLDFLLYFRTAGKPVGNGFLVD